MNQLQKVEFNDLPDEIKLSVFAKMDFNTLLTSTLVSKKWNEMIGDNKAIMKKIQLGYNSSGHRKEFPEKFTRNYQSLKIRQNGDLEWNSWNTIMTIIEQYGSELRNLEIDRSHFSRESIKHVKRLLSSEFPKLETLTLSHSFFRRINIDLSSLIHLKSLVLVSIYCGVLKLPDTTQLTSLRIGYFDCLKPPEHLIDFLTSQEILEELEISHCGLNDSNFEKLQEIKFPLKKLVLHKHENCFGSEENLLIFMHKFVNTLEELDIERAFPDSVYEMIFKNFLKLKTLTIDINDAPTNESFFDKLDSNSSVRELIIYGMRPLLDLSSPVQGFIGNLPNIETLVLHKTILSNELMLFISVNLKMLKNLRVKNILCGVFDSAFNAVEIPGLKSITVDKLVNDQECWKQIVRAFPNIEVLQTEITFGSQILNENCVNIISEGWPKLKHINLGVRHPLQHQIQPLIDQFVHNCKELEKMKVETAIEENVISSDIVFPEQI